ncbi:MAG TPA: formate dehydrogenase accessory sulfurtransferase FdhD [Syntrophobacteraceae bacterium]|nr:formate dehydrogenase accessory sulfurtransferase FdhD [Syntrophobacteraceae bacterium]
MVPKEFLRDQELPDKDVSRDEDEETAPVSTWVFDKNQEGVLRRQWIVKEQPVTLYLNGEEMVTLLCAGHHLDELAIGFLHAEGFLKEPQDLERIEIDGELGKVEAFVPGASPLLRNLWEKRTITSGCGKGSVFYYALDSLLAQKIQSPLRVSPRQVLDRIDDLNRLSETYRRTHGVHNTALASPEEILLFRNDIGRHNAVDMIVGHVFQKRISLEDKFILTTGRLTSEILIKAAKVGLPMLVSRNTATTLAVELAGSLNITLIGYARGGKFTVYSGEERVVGGELGLLG